MYHRVLIIGAGVREHAIAQSLLESGDNQVILFSAGKFQPAWTYAFPEHSIQHIDMPDDDAWSDISKFQYHAIQLVIIGPEKYLGLEGGNGCTLTERLNYSGIPVVGPRDARLELSKTYGYGWAHALDPTIVPKQMYLTQPYSSPSSQPVALLSESSPSTPCVVKLDGPAGGKGVRIFKGPTASRDALKYCQELPGYPFDSLNQYAQKPLITEYLEGHEFTYTSICDGETIIHTIPVIDHKQHNGVNTGGMGTYSGYVPFLDEDDIREVQRINELSLRIPKDGRSNYRAGEVMDYKGFLYSNFIKTKDGIKLIEYNCRLGDSDAVNILRSLRGVSGLELFRAIAEGTLESIRSQMLFDATCNIVCKYYVPPGYPSNTSPSTRISVNLRSEESGTPCPTLGNGNLLLGNLTKEEASMWFTTGSSRSFATVHTNVPVYVDDAYECAEEGRGPERLSPPSFRVEPGYDVIMSRIMEDDEYYSEQGMEHLADVGIFPTTYEEAGVSVDRNEEVVALIKDEVESTYTNTSNEYTRSQVLSKFGDFAGVIKGPGDGPSLVMSTDGVGSKTELLREVYGEIEGLQKAGRDLVHHSINDIAVTGATPLAFLDYYASAKIAPECVLAAVQGIAGECRRHGVALMGGETAEMKGVYTAGACDLVGTIIGTLPVKQKVLPLRTEPGDIVIAFPAKSPHTNGYTLIRKMLMNYGRDHDNYLFSRDFQEQLVGEHECYNNIIQAALQDLPSRLGGHKEQIKAFCHITGGGLTNNLPRILGSNQTVDYGTHVFPPFYKLLQRLCGLTREEMFKTFNCGVGLVMVVDPVACKQEKFQDFLDHASAFTLGEVEDTRDYENARDILQ